MAEEQPGNRGPADWMRRLAMALDLPFLLIGSMIGGGFIGYVLDEWLHTTPWLMLVLGGLGFVAGLRAMLQTIAASSGKPPGGKPPGAQGGEREK